MVLPLTRREILKTVGSSFLFLPQFGKIAQAIETRKEFYASAYMDHKGRYGVAIVDEEGAIVFSHPLPARGHGMAYGEKVSWLVTFARRPENFALATDWQKQKPPVLFKTPEDTHFSGHGTFSKDGKLLFAAENAFEKEVGVIGIYDALSGFKRVAEMPSYGIGPHEIIFMPDGKTLCVANGGILTHPDTGRTKLNLNTMKSNIAFIDSENGELIEFHETPSNFQKLSLRHMAVDRTQKVWLGGQHQGSQFEATPLIASVGLGRELQFIELPENDQVALKHYVGSVAVNRDGSQVSFTSPKGNVVLIVDAADGKVINSFEQNKVCGVSPKKDSFLTSSEDGDFGHMKHSLHWDNHIVLIRS